MGFSAVSHGILLWASRTATQGLLLLKHFINPKIWTFEPHRALRTSILRDQLVWLCISPYTGLHNNPGTRAETHRRAVGHPYVSQMGPGMFLKDFEGRRSILIGRSQLGPELGYSWRDLPKSLHKWIRSEPIWLLPMRMGRRPPKSFRNIHKSLWEPWLCSTAHL